MTIQRLVNAITGGEFDEKFKELYGNSERIIMKQRARYINAAEHFSRTYPECDDVRIFSSPVCVNICGEHTYHQGGCSITAAVTPDIIAIVGENEEDVININSSNFSCCTVGIDGSFPNDDEKSSGAEFIKEAIAAFTEKNVSVKGFNAYISSDIPSDSGFSSAAAFENLIGIIINNYYNNNAMSAEDIAKMSRDVEMACFGENFGIIDQVAGAVGGFVSAKLNDKSEPLTNAVDYDFASSGYSMCITAVSGDDSQDLSDYDDMKCGMEEAAEYLGRSLLRDVDEEEFYEKLPKMRKSCSDMAVLSAICFFEENRRAADEAEALEIGDTEEFFRLFDRSGNYPVSQAAAAAIAISKRFLGENGAVRVYGNEIVQAFVPSYMAEDYAEKMNYVFGDESCLILGIRSRGAEEI